MLTAGAHLLEQEAASSIGAMLQASSINFIGEAGAILHTSSSPGGPASPTVPTFVLADTFAPTVSIPSLGLSLLHELAIVSGAPLVRFHSTIVGTIRVVGTVGDQTRLQLDNCVRRPRAHWPNGRAERD